MQNLKSKQSSAELGATGFYRVLLQNTRVERISKDLFSSRHTSLKQTRVMEQPSIVYFTFGPRQKSTKVKLEVAMKSIFLRSTSPPIKLF